MAKILADSLKKISSLVQDAEPGTGLSIVAGVCGEFADFIGGEAAIIDGRGKLVMQTSAIFRTKESIDGKYVDSRVSDRLNGIMTLYEFDPSGKAALKLDGGGAEYKGGLILPLISGPSRVATVAAYSPAPFNDEGRALAHACGVTALLILDHLQSMEAKARQREIRAVKQTVGSLSYSELAAVLYIFREIGAEGTTVIARAAEKLEMARSVIVTALRKLEGSGLIETRSLGVKGTHIKVTSGNFLEEIYKVRD